MSRFRCQVCGVPFDSAAELEEHHLADHEGREIPFRDPIAKAHGTESKSSRTLPFKTLEEALVDAPDEPAWLWRGYLAPGASTLLAGKPKVGKSTFIAALLAALSTGGEFLGTIVPLTRVLLLSEEGPDTLAEKSRRFGIDGKAVHLLMRREVGKEPWPEIVKQPIAICKTHNIGLLVVDTFDKWVGLRSDDENKAGAVVEKFEPLDGAKASGLAVLVNTHQRKGAGEHGEAVRGSNALAGAVDILVEFERPAAHLNLGKTARLIRGLSRYPATPDELAVNLEDNAWRAIDVGEERAEADRAQILDVLRQIGEPAEAKVVAEMLDIVEGTARSKLNKLMGHGVTRTGEGKKGDPRVYQPTIPFREPSPLVTERKP